MAHQALYQKYRPQSFTDLLGQAPISATLKAAIASDKVAHAYLFTGSRGTGKTTTARLLAKGINCQKPKEGEPDATCEMCRGIAAGTVMDVLEIDAASNRGIDEIRELRDKVRFAPGAAKRKVYIIDEVHMLTKEAFNALLKTLEEPPAHAVFILATTEPHKVPQTIISRCQRFDFRPATTTVLAAYLVKIATAEERTLALPAAELIAAAARGSFRDALSILDVVMSGAETDITAEHIRQVLGLADSVLIGKLERALVARDRTVALTLLQQAGEQGIDSAVLREGLITYLRSILLARAGLTAPDEVKALAADWNLKMLALTIRRLVEAADSTSEHLPELTLELTILELLGDDQTRPGDPVAAVTSSLATKHVTETPGVKAASVKASAPTSSSVTPPPVASPLTSRSLAQSKSPASPPAATPRPAATPVLAPTEDSPGQASASVASTATAAQDVPSAPDTPKTPITEAAGLWEELLRRTKTEYSLSVCLQKTRPLALDHQEFKLAVQSDFFLKKLQDAKSKQKVQAICAETLGRSVTLRLTIADAETRDIFDDALAVFEGAKVE